MSECGVWIVCLCLCAKCLCLATLCLYFICLEILKIYIYVVRSYGTQTVIKSQTNKPQQELGGPVRATVHRYAVPSHSGMSEGDGKARDKNDNNICNNHTRA